jgi:hypothetical protein
MGFKISDPPAINQQDFDLWFKQAIKVIRENLRALTEFSLVSDRGDPSAADFTEATLTTDGAWHDMDLSTIVGATAKYVVLRVSVYDDAIDSYLRFRKNGNTNEYNSPIVRTQVANCWNDATFIVPLDTGRVIEYKGSNVAFGSIIIVVSGWMT